MNTTLTGPAAAYLAEVRTELSDLPPGELEDVLDDVTDHLTEVTAELTGEPSAQALADRLGTPRQYADELRTAAGYPPRGQAARPENSGAMTALRWGIVAATVGPFFLITGIFSGSPDSGFLLCLLGLAVVGGAGALGLRALQGRHPRVVLDTPRGSNAAGTIRGILDQLSPGQRRELRAVGQPVWWVARGIVVGGGVFGVFGAGAATVVAALAGAAFSVWVGRRTQEDRRWLWYVVPLNVVAAIAVPVWLVASLVGGGPVGRFDNPGYVGSSGYNGGEPGLAVDGQPITNIYPFDAAGRPVKVRLYDEKGQPINLPVQNCAASWGDSDSTEPGVTNLFPQTVVVQDQDGFSDPDKCRETDKPPFAAPPMPATPTTSPLPTSPLATPGAPTATQSLATPGPPTPTQSLVTPTQSLPTPGASVPVVPTTAPPVRTPGVTPTVVPTR